MQFIVFVTEQNAVLCREGEYLFAIMAVCH